MTLDQPISLVPTAPAPRLILAVDPGFAELGIAVVDAEGRQPRICHEETVRTKPPTSDTNRLAYIRGRIVGVLEQFPVAAMGVEDQRNAQTNQAKEGRFTNKVAYVNRVVEMVHTIGALRGLPVIEVTPGQAKVAVGCTARAGKKQVQRGVEVITGVIRRRSSHAADAIAIGVAAGRRAARRSLLEARS